MGDCIDPDYLKLFADEHPETPTEVFTVAEAFRKQQNGFDRFAKRCGNLLRQAIDEVVDMPRTGRYALAQIEKTEKTYIGTKVEIVFRHEMELEKGDKLDLLVDGIEVDVKNTIGNNWTIPTEAVGQVCVMLRSDDINSRYSVGLIRCDDEYLNAGKNKDGKRTISKLGKEKTLWLVRDGKLPQNFYLQMDSEIRKHVLGASSANERLRRLFHSHICVPITPQIIACTAQQKDSMKRIRANGGAKDIIEDGAHLLLCSNWTVAKPELDRRGLLELVTDRYTYFCVKKDG